MPEFSNNLDTRSSRGGWLLVASAAVTAAVSKAGSVVGLGRGEPALPEFPQPVHFRPGGNAVHRAVHGGEMPSGRQHRGKVIIWHVAFLSELRQDLQHAPLGEFGTFGGPGYQVNHPGEANPVGIPAPAMAGAEPTGAAAAISTTAHPRLPGETGVMI